MIKIRYEIHIMPDNKVLTLQATTLSEAKMMTERTCSNNRVELLRITKNADHYEIHTDIGYIGNIWKCNKIWQG